MDPVSLIVAALAAGAAGALKETAGEAVKDAYNGLKSLLKRKLGNEPAAQVAIDKHEESPDVWEKPLEEELGKSRVADDEEVVRRAPGVAGACRSGRGAGGQVQRHDLGREGDRGRRPRQGRDDVRERGLTMRQRSSSVQREDRGRQGRRDRRLRDGDPGVQGRARAALPRRSGRRSSRRLSRNARGASWAASTCSPRWTKRSPILSFRAAISSSRVSPGSARRRSSASSSSSARSSITSTSPRSGSARRRHSCRTSARS